MRRMPCFLYSSDELDALNHRIWSDIMTYGRPLQFGGPGEKVKHARHIHATVQVYGEALDRLMKGDMPHGWLYRGQAVKEYMKQFDDPSTWKGFEYTYGERLLKYRVTNPEYPKSCLGQLSSHLSGTMPPIELEVDQLDVMRELLEWSIDEQVSNQRIVAITYRPLDDMFKEDLPCLQVAKLYLLQDNEVGLDCCYRSHDYGHGWAANGAFLTSGFSRNVIEPAGGKLTELIFDSMSAQLYDTDTDMIYDEIGWPDSPTSQTI